MATRKPGLGLFGEEEACARLQELGYHIRERNFRTRLGEIDLVAEEGGELVFAEVKARSGLSHGLPCEAVDRRKRRRMTRAAVHYLTEHNEERAWRFDVVEVVVMGADLVEVRVLRRAFEVDERDLQGLE